MYFFRNSCLQRIPVSIDFKLPFKVHFKCLVVLFTNFSHEFQHACAISASQNSQIEKWINLTLYNIMWSGDIVDGDHA